MSDFPIGDAQFWIVTAICSLVLGFGLWRFVRAIRNSNVRKRGKSVSLTIERRPRD